MKPCIQLLLMRSRERSDSHDKKTDSCHHASKPVSPWVRLKVSPARVCGPLAATLGFGLGDVTPAALYCAVIDQALVLWVRISLDRDKPSSPAWPPVCDLHTPATRAG